MAFFVFLAMALISFDAADPTFNNATEAAAANWLGPAGSYLADIFLQALGLAAVFLILPFLTWGWRLVAGKGLPYLPLHLAVLPLGAVAWAVFASLVPKSASWPIETGYGGFLGGRIAALLSDGYLAILNSAPPAMLFYILFFTLGVLGTYFTLGISRTDWLAAAGSIRKALLLPFRRQGQASPAKPASRQATAAGRRRDPVLTPAGKKRRVTNPFRAKRGERAIKESQTSLDFGDRGAFSLPTLDLLSKAKGPARAAAINEEALEQNARLLESVLDDFGIKGDILKVRPGPVVTLYELEPAPGTKSSRIIGLADDIARSMSAISARVAVIPGRNVIGIELPNRHREVVYLREILSSAAFENSPAPLALALGKDIGGSPVIADLATMPHLLVAGTTGSGKSVGINAMILSLLYRLPPNKCKLILVDPKMLELSVYEGIPHLLTPVVTEPKKAVVALKWAVREMEERYRAMSKLGVRNINAYNKQVEEARLAGKSITRKVQTGFDKETGQPVYEQLDFDLAPLPQIVIVIDEMADLMLVAGKDVEAMVQRLSQMARAAGLHLITATQRPSVDVITGTIKANFPTRISFQVTSKIDSRTILGEQGAEQLLGQGDMLYMAAGGRITRVHGPFVSDQEVEKVVAMLKRQGAPDYLEDITEEPEDGFDSAFIPGPNKDDGDLYNQAVGIVQRDRKASTSYIQRRLKIGYNRAASLIEEMEASGVISAANHAGKREVLLPDPDEQY